MPLDNKPLESIEEADLRALIDNKVAEGKNIDYKQALPGNSDSDKREFLSDLSSLANASGGHLVFGIKEKDGVPVQLSGTDGANPDAEILRLENLTRDGLEPRIPGVSMHPVALKAGGLALVIRVPRRWSSPHRVTLKGHGHFYSRNSAGKYRLDVSELRAAFALSETAAERIRGFRAERLSMIVSGETPIHLSEGAKTVLHMVPLGASDQGNTVDLSSVASDPTRFPPLSTSSWSNRYNFDGFLTFTPPGIRASSYLQFFRDGSVEAVETGLLDTVDQDKYIPSVIYENELIQGVRRFLSAQDIVGVEPPIFLMLSMLGVSGYKMGVSKSLLIQPQHPIDRDSLIAPEILIDSFNGNVARAMKPAFDAIWNAAGYPESINYREGGRWMGH